MVSPAKWLLMAGGVCVVAIDTNAFVRQLTARSHQMNLLLVHMAGTTMEIRVTRPFIVSFIPGDQNGGPDCFISCLHVLFTEINQIKIMARYTWKAFDINYYSRIAISLLAGLMV